MVKTYKSAMVCMLIVLVTFLSGCVPDVSEYNYILDHWKGEWSGWYEISDAVGSFSDLDGIHEQCTAEISMDPQTKLWMELFDLDGVKIYDFKGPYKHNDKKQYGEAWFETVVEAGSKSKRFSAMLPLDESQGDENLCIIQGRIGTEKEGMDILIYLHRSAANEKSCTMTVQAHNSGINEFGEDVGYGGGTPVTYQVLEGDCFYEKWDELQQNSNTVEDYDFHLDEFMKIKELKEDGVVLEIQGQEWQVEYDQEFTLHSLEMVMDGANTSYQIKFSGQENDAE